MSNPLFDAAGLQVFERGWLSSNNVLFAADQAGAGATLVDSGYASHAPQTLALVQHALGARQLARIVNTHLHSDHCGGNHALQEAFDCVIDVPVAEASKVDRWDEAALSYRDTGQRCPRFRRGGVLRDGDVMLLGAHEWQIIGAPGHDPASVVLYQPDFELLISADALWENGFGVVFPELEGEQAFDEVRATLERIGGLRVKWLIPGHGAPFEDFAGALRRAHTRLDSFEADPARHARYAAKVLIKFHLLEVQQQPVDELFAWMRATSYMGLAHGLHFAGVPFADWCHILLEELAKSGAVSIDAMSVRNL